MENNSSNKTSIGLIIGFIAVIVAIVGVGITLAIILISQNSSSGGSGTANSTSSDEIKNKQNDAQRKDDLARFLTAVNNFQTNNSGKTPWAEGSTNKNFVSRYIDADCSAKTPDKADSTCGKQFSDPDGNPYFFVYEGKASSSKTVNPTKDHGIYVYTYAMCSRDGSKVETSSSARDVALFYKLSDGSIACSDNQ